MRQTIWVDLDNTPHVPFFKPIIRELEKQGLEIAISARDAYQVCDLAQKMCVPYVQIGHHYGKNRIMKVVGVIVRCLQLIPFVIRTRPVLGLSHGSRSQTLICNLLKIPTIGIMDYEYGKPFPFTHPTYRIFPEALSAVKPRRKATTVSTYPGLKEDVYVPEFRPDKTILQLLELDEREVIVAVRPPASEAHYFCASSKRLFEDFMDWIVSFPNVRVVMLPRNKRQERKMLRERSCWFEGNRVTIPKAVIDGLNLLWHCDLAVSGGGTMNREAAALGVPVYSIFRGPIGAVDQQLAREGRLVLLETKDDFPAKIAVSKRQKSVVPDFGDRPALREIVRQITALASHYTRSTNAASAFYSEKQ